MTKHVQNRRADIDVRDRYLRRIVILEEALRPLVEAYEKGACPIGDSDLDNEQPRGVWAELGAWRRATRALKYDTR